MKININGERCLEDGDLLNNMNGKPQSYMEILSVLKDCARSLERWPEVVSVEIEGIHEEPEPPKKGGRKRAKRKASSKSDSE